jgi:hypothetical protein
MTFNVHSLNHFVHPCSESSPRRSPSDSRSGNIWPDQIQNSLVEPIPFTSEDVEKLSENFTYSSTWSISTCSTSVWWNSSQAIQYNRNESLYHPLESPPVSVKLRLLSVIQLKCLIWEKTIFIPSHSDKLEKRIVTFILIGLHWISCKPIVSAFWWVDRISGSWFVFRRYSAVHSNGKFGSCSNWLSQELECEQFYKDCSVCAHKPTTIGGKKFCTCYT